MANYSYEYDKECEVIVRHNHDELPMLMRKSKLVWENVFDDGNNSYARAIFLGQGCWDRLINISLEEAEKKLKEWGLPSMD